MSQRPGMTYIPFASTTCPRGRAGAGNDPTLTMRFPSMTTVEPRRSAPLETSTTVALVIVRVCAERRELTRGIPSRTVLRNRVMLGNYAIRRRVLDLRRMLLSRRHQLERAARLDPTGEPFRSNASP